MSFVLSHDRKADLFGYWAKYQSYIESVRDRIPLGALKLALAEEWYDFNCHQCPHDAWLEECRIIESSTPEELEFPRWCSLEVRLLGAYHDGHILLRYPRLFSYGMQTSTCEKGLGDWLYDELRLSDRGHLLHEIEWANGSHWLIEADDIEFEWRPLKAEKTLG